MLLLFLPFRDKTDFPEFEDRWNYFRQAQESHLRRPSHPGEVVSVDQLESSVPGFIGQMTGRLTKQRIVGSTIFVDHASDLSYVYHQTSMTSDETLRSKLAFEKFAASHGVNIKHYHADNGRFKEK